MNAPSSNARAGILIVLLAGVFTYGLIRIFSLQFTTGEAYPEYSSLRSRPDGAKLLYDSLARLPGVVVSRNYYPLEYLDESSATILLLSLDGGHLQGRNSYLDQIERLARRGNRVVVTLNQSSAPPARPDGDAGAARELDKHWHVKVALDPDEKRKRRLYFTEAPDWSVLDRDGARLLALERSFDKGSVVLVSESGDFTNRATVTLERLALVSAAIGAGNRVVFDELHLGISESGSVVGLARRFRLAGMAAGLAFCAALFIWKNAAGFPPPADAPRSETMAGRTSISGLFTLLRRHVKPEELASLCWNEWLTGHRREVTAARVAGAEAILRDRARRPLEAVREIQTVLYSNAQATGQAKGPL